MSFIDFLPQILAVASLAAMTLAVLWTIVRQYAPIARGRPMGVIEIIGRRPDGTCEEYKGPTTEVSLLHAGNETAVKKILSTAIGNRVIALENQKSKIQPDKSGDLQKQIDDLNKTKEKMLKEDLTKIYRFAIMRQGMEKHAFLQWGALEKSLDGYVSGKGTKMVFGFGSLSKGILFGDIKTEKEKTKLPRTKDLNLGAFTLHYLRPDIRKNEAYSDPPEYLKTIVELVPAIVDLHEEINSLKEQLINSQRQVRQANMEKSAMSKITGRAVGMVAKFDPKLAELLKQDLLGMSNQKRELVNVFLMGVPTLLCIGIAESLNVNALAGGAIGVFIGSFLIAVRGR